VPIKPAILLQPTHNILLIVADPFQKMAGWMLGVEEDIGGSTTEAVAGITEQLQR
jgi:hypothetical protein